MTDLWHELLHVGAPYLAPYVDYVLGLAVVASAAWVRAHFQVKEGRIAALLTELEARREESWGRRPPGYILKQRAMRRARDTMHPLVRPLRDARLDDIVERGVPRKD